MHIPTPENSLANDVDMRNSLQRFIDHPEPEKSAPCHGCKVHLPKNCSPKCNDVAQALSIDPVRYPIEPMVIPIVFEVTASAGLMTCWSCEGHMSTDNKKIWKLPQVSFYSDTPIYAHLVLMHLLNLKQNKKLHYLWHIVLGAFTDSLNMLYSIEPNLNREADPELIKLQQDMQTIGDGMHTKIKMIARGYLNKFL